MHSASRRVVPVESLFDRIPLWLLFLVTLALVVGPVEVGYRLGRWERQRPMHEDEKWVEPILAPVLGLLALMLAFTFGIAQSRFDERRTTIFQSANAISTAYLRADLAPEPYRGELRRLLRTEVDVRLSVKDDSNIRDVVKRVGLIHDTLWRAAADAAVRIQQSALGSLEVSAVNEVIDSYDYRLAALFHGRIPAPIWVGLLALAIIGTGLIGYASGLAGSRRSPAVIPLALSFAIVIMLIADLDRPYAGLLRASQESLAELRESMDPK